MWARPRTTRLTVYLAGMAVNLVLAAVGIALYQLPTPAPVARFGSVLFTTQMIVLSL